ncbi:hypothetical protein CSOJ01_13132 [Colletotrichum sojae]|uniref:Uncharacterized protein n=1 Tax=Colletotrichum sojae TaxID=2175907 RepID=A0A8H6IT33_9PEZI|nr:hypothetical protein CSOJ01_13132 [Colletotrichum sojae]
MNFVDHFDGCSYIYEDDRTTITFGYAMEQERPPPQPLPLPPAYTDGWGPSQHENIRTWLDGVVMEEDHKPLVADVLQVIGGLQQPSPGYYEPGKQQQQGGPVVNVHTVGPGFIGRAPPMASTEFLANIVVVAILLLFAPGFTLLAAGVFVTSRVAERWVGHD